MFSQLVHRISKLALGALLALVLVGSFLPAHALDRRDHDGDGRRDRWQYNHGRRDRDFYRDRYDHDGDGRRDRWQANHWRRDRDYHRDRFDRDGDGRRDRWQYNHDRRDRD